MRAKIAGRGRFCRAILAGVRRFINGLRGFSSVAYPVLKGGGSRAGESSRPGGGCHWAHLDCPRLPVGRSAAFTPLLQAEATAQSFGPCRSDVEAA